jgi:hypothetical protein
MLQIYLLVDMSTRKYSPTFRRIVVPSSSASSSLRKTSSRDVSNYLPATGVRSQKILMSCTTDMRTSNNSNVSFPRRTMPHALCCIRLTINRLLKQVIEGKIKGQIEVTRRRGRRRKKLLDDLGDRRGYSHLKE